MVMHRYQNGIIRSHQFLAPVLGQPYLNIMVGEAATAKLRSSIIWAYPSTRRRLFMNISRFIPGQTAKTCVFFAFWPFDRLLVGRAAG
jgi:hypothetical protein